MYIISGFTLSAFDGFRRYAESATDVNEAIKRIKEIVDNDFALTLAETIIDCQGHDEDADILCNEKYHSCGPTIYTYQVVLRINIDSMASFREKLIASHSGRFDADSTDGIWLDSSGSGYIDTVLCDFQIINL